MPVGKVLLNSLRVFELSEGALDAKGAPAPCLTVAHQRPVAACSPDGGHGSRVGAGDCSHKSPHTRADLSVSSCRFRDQKSHAARDRRAISMPGMKRRLPSLMVARRPFFMSSKRVLRDGRRYGRDHWFNPGTAHHYQGGRPCDLSRRVSPRGLRRSLLAAPADDPACRARSAQAEGAPDLIHAGNPATQSRCKTNRHSARHETSPDRPDGPF
jgi:hypothetical protein